MLQILNLEVNKNASAIDAIYMQKQYGGESNEKYYV